MNENFRERFIRKKTKRRTTPGFTLVSTLLVFLTLILAVVIFHDYSVYQVKEGYLKYVPVFESIQKD